jgi:tetratricopeptide (TPR) repeat protein
MSVEEYRIVSRLSPAEYDAQISLGQLQHGAGRLDDAEQTLRNLSLGNPPLPIKDRIYELLQSVYDDSKRRVDAARAAASHLQAEREIHLRYPSDYSQAQLCFDARRVAIREEELGMYADAADHFAEAVRWSDNNKVSEAVRYEADLGHGRCLRQLGKVNAALNTCNEWRERIRQSDPSFQNDHWGGSSVMLARWEFSCGDFDEGSALLEDEMRRRPTSDTPYLVLEEAYRSRRQSEIADKVHAVAVAVRSEHDKAILDSLRREVVDLSKRGAVVHIER